jgi:hypothetical protein
MVITVYFTSTSKPHSIGKFTFLKSFNIFEPNNERYKSKYLNVNKKKFYLQNFIDN